MILAIVKLNNDLVAIIAHRDKHRLVWFGTIGCVKFFSGFDPIHLLLTAAYGSFGIGRALLGKSRGLHDGLCLLLGVQLNQLKLDNHSIAVRNDWELELALGTHEFAFICDQIMFATGCSQ